MNAMRRLIGFALHALFCVGFALTAGNTNAQSYTPGYPPSFSTVPTNPPAWQPFQLSVRAFAVASAMGPTYTNVSGNEISVFFDYGCGFICPGGGGPFYHPYSIAIPPLAEGTYTVRFIAGGEPVETYSFVVGGASTPISTPATGFTSLVILSLLLALAAAMTGLRATRSRVSRPI